MSMFNDIKGAASEFQTLPEGMHNVTLVSYKEVNSFMNHDGTAKKHNHEYADATPQFYVVVKSVDGKGSLPHRLNACGYVKFNDLTDKEIESGKFTDLEGYACTTNKDGVVTRILDEEKTKGARQIFAEFLYATSGEEGNVEGLKVVVADEEPFTIKVVNEPFDGKPSYKISRFRPYDKNATAEAEAAGSFIED